MSVDGIIDRIMADAKQDAAQIADEARKQAKTIHRDNEKDAQEYYEHQKSLLDERYRKEKERAVLNRRLQQRKSVLASRQRWMDRAFELAHQRLVEQPMPEYQKLMKGLISSVSSTKDEIVQFGQKGQEGELKSLISELNRETGGSFRLSEERGEFAWGFILRKGKVETNMSIDSLFKYKRSDLEQKAWELFNVEL
jgi:V/A-type H+-transporting ATPase subunit E